MAFLAALAANLWVVRPWLLFLLAGPLFTLVLYQRTALHSRIASRDARTDNSRISATIAPTRRRRAS